MIWQDERCEWMAKLLKEAISMLRITAYLAIHLLVLNCLVECAAPASARRNEILPTSKEPTKGTLEVKVTNARSKEPARPTAKTTAKGTAARKKATAKKTTTPPPLKEFSLDEIIFRGRQSNEANAFIKANEQRGKTLETTYEHVREQDLNDIEALVRKRNGSGRLTRS